MKSPWQFLQDKDGNWDEQPLLSILGVATFLVLEVWTVMEQHQPFQAESFGIGFGAVMGATLGGLAFRERSNRGGSNAGMGNQPGA